MIRFDTSTYESSHGKQPRGDGYWAFQLMGAPAHVEQPVFLNGTLTQCRAKLAKQFPWLRVAKVLP